MREAMREEVRKSFCLWRSGVLGDCVWAFGRVGVFGRLRSAVLPQTARKSRRKLEYSRETPARPQNLGMSMVVLSPVSLLNTRMLIPLGPGVTSTVKRSKSKVPSCVRSISPNRSSMTCREI